MFKVNKIIVLFFLFITSHLFAQEICSNGIDDDSDGLIDLNDADCLCNTFAPSLIANPSFETNTGCPSTYQQFNLVSNWVSGNGEAIDYLNTCGFTRFSGVDFPNGNGIAGCYYLEDRLRYIAQCLPSPLTSGTAYKLNFETSALSIDNAGNQLDIVVGGLCGFNYNSIPYPVTITLYGTSNCADLPWAGTGSPIGSGNWVVLGQVVYSPSDTLWNDLSINFTPSANIAAIAIGPPSTQIPQFPIYNQGGNGNIGCYPFIQYDNFILNESNAVVDIEISQSGGYCTNDLVFTATSTVSGGTWQWYKNGIALNGQTNANIQISTNNFGVGNYTARYTLLGTCFTEDYLLQLPSGLDAEFTSGASCMETVVAFTDLSFAGAYPITNWQWDFGDGNTSSDRHPVHRYAANGTYTVQLIITTNQGCKDTITHTQTANKPTPLDISTCSCNGLGISLIPNHSFEDHSCCPTNYSQLNCADTWIQASGATSDYWNTCGTIQMDYNPPLPPPDGDGFAGYIDFGTGYKEYIGACLTEPMQAGQTYNLTFQMASTSTANFAFWGATNCNDLPFSGTECPQGVGSWQILQQQTYTLGGGTWHTVSMTLTLTQDIYAVLLGPDCGSGPPGIGYYYVDKLALSSSILQPVELEGSYCSNDVVLKSGAASDTFNLHYQWFKGGIELIGETDSILNVSANGYGTGDYQIMGVYRDGCDVSPIFTVDTAYIDFDTEITTSCPGLQNGEISITNVGGQGDTPPFLFQLNNNTPTNDSIFSNLNPGSYVVKVIDSKGCIDSATVVIDSLAAPVAIFNHTDVCEGDTVFFTDESTISNGAITSWQWFFGDNSPNASTQNTQHLYANTGQYTVTLILQSDSGCTDAITNSIIVYEKSEVNAGNNQTICSGSNATLSGAIGGAATGATWSGGSGTYSPNNNSLNATYTPSNTEINAGSATLILTTNDPTGPCSSISDTLVITINPLPTVSAGLDQTICNGNTVSLAGTIGGAATSGIWSGGNGAYTPDNTSATATYTPTTLEANSGMVNIAYTTDDPLGPCASVTDSMTITINQLPTANAGSPQYVCSGANITLAGAIGGSAESATWSGGNGTFNPSNASLNAVYTPTEAEYLADSVNLTLTTNDPAGPCSFSTSNVTMHFYKNPVISFFADSTQGCPIHCTDFTNNSTVGGGDNIVSWSWDFGDGSGNSTEQSPNHCYLNSGFYDVSLTATSNHQCTSTETINHHIEVFNVPSAQFTASPNPATVLNPTVYFTNQSSQDVTQWHWDFGDGESLLSDTANPAHTYPENIDASYNVILIVNNANMCYDTTYLEIIINPEYTFFIPNAFSPNEDGVNDFFYGSGIGIIVYDLWVFDRWGNMVFHSQELNKGWDGKSNNGSEASQMDVFVWKVQLTNVFNKKFDFIGTVTLVR
jgi:gliding motility-associated-like protein